MELKGIRYLRKKLSVKKIGVDKRYEFYDMKNKAKDFKISTPPNLYNLQSTLGWCGKAVDALSDRLVLTGFDNDTFQINDIYQYNNPSVLFDSAILSALISSCCFLYVSQDEKGNPRIQVIDGSNATGIIDPITNFLYEGYAVLERDPETKAPTIEAYFTKGCTEIFRKGQQESEKVFNNAPYPLLVPIINRPDATRPFGHSRISKACMSIQEAAMRTIKRSEISAEFYSFPQKYVTGLSEDAEAMDKWQATMSSMITFTKDDEGDKPTLGQFAQASMSPHLEQLRMFASLFAGETGLTADDLGFTTSNPSSAEAIKAAHENLRLAARKAQRTFGSGFINAGFLAACIRDGIEYDISELYSTKAIWAPIFEPDAAMLSGLGDGIIKINQSVPNYIDESKLEQLTGM